MTVRATRAKTPSGAKRMMRSVMRIMISNMPWKKLYWASA